MENLVKNVMKTADANKILSAIFERSYNDLYMHHFCGCSMSLSKVMTKGVILHCPTKQEPLKAQPKMG